LANDGIVSILVERTASADPSKVRNNEQLSLTADYAQFVSYDNVRRQMFFDIGTLSLWFCYRSGIQKCAVKIMGLQQRNQELYTLCPNKCNSFGLLLLQYTSTDFQTLRRHVTVLILLTSSAACLLKIIKIG